MKLIKDEKIVKLPKVKDSVSKTLGEARMVSCERAWDRVIVIGESKKSASYHASKMPLNDLIAMLERVKHDLLSS